MSSGISITSNFWGEIRKAESHHEFLVFVKVNVDVEGAVERDQETGERTEQI